MLEINLDRVVEEMDRAAKEYLEHNQSKKILRLCEARAAARQVLYQLADDFDDLRNNLE